MMAMRIRRLYPNRVVQDNWRCCPLPFIIFIFLPFLLGGGRGGGDLILFKVLEA